MSDFIVHPAELDWLRKKATNSQLERILREYRRTLKIASLAEKYRQLKTEESFDDLTKLLDEHWEEKERSKPNFFKEK